MVLTIVASGACSRENEDPKADAEGTLDNPTAQTERWPARKERYKPPGDIYPQIIQAFDYESIEAIEVLASSLAKMGEDESIESQVEGSKILFTSKGKISVVQIGDNLVNVHGKKFSAKPTRVLFTTLKRLLEDLSTEGQIRHVRSSQWTSRGYSRHTRVEWNVPPNVVSLHGASNGPNDEERLYVLDLVSAKESYFWNRENVISKNISHPNPQFGPEDWHSLKSSWQRSIVKPSDSHLDEVMSLLPRADELAEDWVTPEARKTTDYIYSNLELLEKEIKMGNSKAVDLAFLMQPIADGAFSSLLDIILGPLISDRPRLFLESLQKHRDLVVRMDSLVGNLGPDYVDDFKGQTKELKRRLEAIRSVNVNLVADTKAEVVRALMDSIKETTE